eukprot:2145739-Amphidinium_carterae.1
MMIFCSTLSSTTSFVKDGHFLGLGIAIFDYVLHDFFNCVFEDGGLVFGVGIAVFDDVLLDRS